MGNDLLRWPLIGTFLRWRHARTALQLVLLAVAIVIVLHGLFGPPVAPANLATVLTWVHYRGLLVIALLAAGNFFCTGCPLILVRDAGRRLHAPARRWPRWLRTKWIGIALLVAVLFTYELFDLWSLPAGTAYLVLAYFGAALVVDLVFTGAAFCKYVCPIGQFNFMAAALSPLELRVRQPAVCGSCRTFDCIKGRAPAHAVATGTGTAAVAVVAAAPEVAKLQRGCELRLFLPGKSGNIDCTFCLDCVQACPHGNVALGIRTPGAEILDERRRSGIGRLAERRDLAALAVVFVFAGLLNAFAMAAPAGTVLRTLANLSGIPSELPLLATVFLVTLVAAPFLLVGGAAAATRLITGERSRSTRDVAVRYVYALLPIGFGVWLAHYGFHLLAGALTIVPVVQSAAADLAGSPVLGGPQWTWVGMQPGAIFPIQVGFVLLGAIGSAALAHGISERDYRARVLAATLPWAVATAAVAGAAIWILSQPMEMRGTIVSG
jgi:polyferredoxin